MLEYLRLRKITTVTNSTDIQIDFPDLVYAPGFTVIAGLLLVPLSVSGSDFIAFIRNGQTSEVFLSFFFIFYVYVTSEVRWAGNPYDKSIREGTHEYLELRSSFAAWTEEQIENTAVLCLVYGKFIEVRRQRKL